MKWRDLDNIDAGFKKNFNNLKCNSLKRKRENDDDIKDNCSKKSKLVFEKENEIKFKVREIMQSNSCRSIWTYYTILFYHFRSKMIYYGLFTKWLIIYQMMSC